MTLPSNSSLDLKSLIPVGLVYLSCTIILLMMDYWNPQQVSHILWFDFLFGIIPSILYMIIMLFFSKCITDITK